MKKEINLVYVDDKIDVYLSKYIGQIEIDEVELKKSEVQFYSMTDNYKTLLSNESVYKADIVIIDSKLFENSNVEKKFSGEEFKMIYTTEFPYSKVIVISQNEGLEIYGTIKKYDSGVNNDSETEYYNNKLRPILNEYIKEIMQKREILKKLHENADSYDSLILEKINALMEGMSTYKELTDDKINALIDIVEKSLKSMNEGL